jgi:hypothetical protein
MEFDFKDFYIGYEEHPRFSVNKIITDDIIRVIVQKYEMIIFTNKGELYGDPNFGCSLENLLYQTKISAPAVRATIIDQINTYIPELSGLNYELSVDFFDDPERFQDIMVVDMKLLDFEIKSVIR